MGSESVGETVNTVTDNKFSRFDAKYLVRVESFIAGRERKVETRKTYR